MADNTVLSFNASIVNVDVYVELLLVSVHVNLAFGPFNRIADAQIWADELECAHAKDQLLKNTAAEVFIFNNDGMPSLPYMNMHMSVAMVAEHKEARKLARYLLAPDTSEKVEPMLAEYALRTANEAVAHSCFLLDKGK